MDAVLPAAQAKRVGVLVNMPLGGRRDGNLISRAAGRDLPDWAAEFGAKSWGQFFLKYVVSHPAVTVAIPGMTRIEHLNDNLDAIRGRMPDAAMRTRMEKFWDQNFDS
jgi:aryl-alcohol dehydrogenase-like predicted oxidoreductase